MTIGTSLFIVAVGAILRYAVKDDIAGIDLPTAGLILMLVGAFGLVLGIYFAFVRKEPDPTMRDPSLRGPR